MYIYVYIRLPSAYPPPPGPSQQKSAPGPPDSGPQPPQVNLISWVVGFISIPCWSTSHVQLCVYAAVSIDWSLEKPHAILHPYTPVIPFLRPKIGSF